MTLLLIGSGCAQCAPDRVGPGVARLTIRNVGTIASLLNADKTCGFASNAVLGAPTMVGQVGGEGSLTFSVKDCLIDATAGLESKNCTGATTTTTGKVTVSATRQVRGKLTGNPTSPIIPSGPDAVTITIEKATFEDFLVVSSASTSSLKMISGSIAAVVSPRLAVSAATGACAVATPHSGFANVQYQPSKLYVSTADNKFDVDVESSSISAQNGVNGSRSNDIGGTITVFGSQVPAIQATDKDGLDAEFTAEKFEASYACTPDLVTPVSFTCANLGPRLAGGVARLSVRTLGTITSMVEANTTCGFSSQAVGGTPTFTGTLGKDNSTGTFTISTPCVITLPADTLLSTDCAGVTTKASGSVSVTGTKRVTGFRTGNPAKPIIPTSPQPAEYDLSVTLTDFEVKSSASTSSLMIKTGSLSGKIAPRTGIDSTSGACSISTPVATFSDMSWTNAAVRLNNDGNNFDLAVGASTLSAQNGTKGTVSNLIEGNITVDGTSYTLTAGGEPLDTAFTQTVFDASYVCTPNLVVPPVDAACSFRQPLGIAAARLLVKGVATSASMINGNTTCGFGAGSVLGAPTNVTGTAGNPGSVEWTVTACTIGPVPADTTLSTNCLGTVTKGSGTVLATGTKTVTGLRGTNPPIVPTSREAATLAVSSVALTSFEVFDLPTGATTPSSAATITGTASVTVKPVAGESNTNAGVFSVSTPISAVESLTMASGTIVIKSAGNQFELALTNVALDAFAGSFGTKSNQLAGSLTVDGQPVTLATPTLLDPDFVQATFNSTYVCAPDLKEVVPFP